MTKIDIFSVPKAFAGTTEQTFEILYFSVQHLWYYTPGHPNSENSVIPNCNLWVQNVCSLLDIYPRFKFIRTCLKNGFKWNWMKTIFGVYFYTRTFTISAFLTFIVCDFFQKLYLYLMVYYKYLETWSRDVFVHCRK